MSHLEQMHNLGNKLVVTAVAFNASIHAFLETKDLSKLSDMFEKITDAMTTHTDVIEQLLTTCPLALLEASQQGITDLFNGGYNEQ